MKNIVRATSFGAVIALALLTAGVKMASSQTAPTVKLPATIQECEKKSGSMVCLPWKLNGNGSEAQGPDGSAEKITPLLNKSNGTKFAFIRTVSSQTGDDLGVFYEAELRNGKIQNGGVTWTVQGIQNYGTWDGTYSYDVANQRAGN